MKTTADQITTTSPQQHDNNRKKTQQSEGSLSNSGKEKLPIKQMNVTLYLNIIKTMQSEISACYRAAYWVTVYERTKEWLEGCQPTFPSHFFLNMFTAVPPTNWEADVCCSRCTLDSLKTLWGAYEKLIGVNILCRPFLCLITQLADVHCSPGSTGRTNPTHRLPLIWCTHPYELPPSLSLALCSAH